MPVRPRGAAWAGTEAHLQKERSLAEPATGDVSFQGRETARGLRVTLSEGVN